MKLVDWLKKAKDEGFALGAFNADTFETMKAVAKAAAQKKSPVIVEVSSGEEKFLGLQNILAVRANLSEEYQIPIFLNLDHADDLETINNSIELGFDLVHFDGSKLPLDENIRLAKDIVANAHAKGVLVEGEIDHFPGSSESHKNERLESLGIMRYSDPSKAKLFVDQTGVDIFAAFIGNVHGVFKDEERLDVNKLKEISKVLPNTFFSLHGGSGVSHDDVKEAIRNGIVKVNINTELRIAYRQTLENVLKGDPEEFAMNKILSPVVKAVGETVENEIDVLGSAHKI